MIFFSFVRIICPLCDEELMSELSEDAKIRYIYRHFSFAESGNTCQYAGKRFFIPVTEVELKEVE